MNRDLYKLSPEENRRIFDEQITPTLYESLVSVDEPIASFFRGQPGAGKSVAQHRRVAELHLKSGPNSVMQVDIDGFRPFHPDYASLQEADEASAAFYTDLDCGEWTERAVSLSMNKRTHVTLEGTLRNEIPTLKTAQEYAERDIHSDLFLLAVHELESRSRIFKRYIEQLHTNGGRGRYTLPEAHDAAYSVLPETAARTVESQLFRAIYIIDQDGDIVDQLNGRSNDAATKTTAALAKARQLHPHSIEAIRDTLADLEPAIRNQPNEMIRRDFEALVSLVRQQSKQIIGGLAIAYAQIQDTV